MNVTLALDEKTVKAGRQYAREHHTTLNNVIRDLLQRTVLQAPSANWADAFFAAADGAKGDSRGRRWKREDLYGD